MPTALAKTLTITYRFALKNGSKKVFLVILDRTLA